MRSAAPAGRLATAGGEAARCASRPAALQAAHPAPATPIPPACRIAGPAASVLASKCLKGKPATVAKTGEACMLLIELEQQAVVVEAVLKAFADKVPKVVLAAVDIVAQAVRWVLALKGAATACAAGAAGAACLAAAAGMALCGAVVLQLVAAAAEPCSSMCGMFVDLRQALLLLLPCEPPFRLPRCRLQHAIVSPHTACSQLLWRQGGGPQAHHEGAARPVWAHAGTAYRGLARLAPCCCWHTVWGSMPAAAAADRPAQSYMQAGVRDKAKEVSVELCAYLGQVGARRTEGGGGNKHTSSSLWKMALTKPCRGKECALGQCPGRLQLLKVTYCPRSTPQGVVAGVLLDKMPAAMRKDVDAAIAELPPGKKQPSRWTRREAAERAAREGEVQPMDVDGGEGGEGAGAAPAPALEEEPVGAALLLLLPIAAVLLLRRCQCCRWRAALLRSCAVPACHRLSPCCSRCGSASLCQHTSGACERMGCGGRQGRHHHPAARLTLVHRRPRRHRMCRRATPMSLPRPWTSWARWARRS